MTRSCLLALVAVVLPIAALGATQDDTVEWDGISHVTFQDRRPLCPIDGETFSVRFQTYAGDLTAARVRVDDGSISWVDASVVDARGPYDVWSAELPATVADALGYVIELTDGSDTDYYGISGAVDTLPGGDESALNFLLDYVDHGHAPIGATPTSDGGAIFKVWAPTRISVFVRGDFNGWSLANPMTQVGEYWVAHVPNASPGQEYKYYFNSSVWNTDARGRALNPSDGLNAIIQDPFAYVWNDDAFVVPELPKMVVYQLHVGTFAGYNDPLGTTPFPSRYVDVAARAGHLAELGVNAVMLNPITEFPGDLSAGYNPQTNWAPEWKYGSPDDLKAMIDALHAEGIAVLLDIVWNHFAISDNFMWFYDGSQIYFDTPPVDTPWGAQADFDEPEVQDYFANSALLWMEEYHFDGFRMDATDFMNIPPQDAAGWALMQRFNDEMDNRWVHKVAIAEQLPDDPWVTRPTEFGGAGFDSQYWDNFTDRLREEILDAAFGDPSMFVIEDIVNGGGQYLTGTQVTNYFELHDECWPSSGGQRMVKTIDTTAPHDDIYAKGRTKLAQGLVMAAPGVPAILQGTEWLEDRGFGTDPINRIDWSKKVTYAGIFAYYRDLIHLRTGEDAFRSDSGLQIIKRDEAGNVIAFQRFDLAGNVFVVIANFDNDDYTGYRVGLPTAGEWSEVINSQATEYEGSGLTNPNIVVDATPWDNQAQSAALNVPGMSLVILRNAPITGIAASEAPAVAPLTLSLAPSPTPSRSTFTYTLPANQDVRVSVFNVQGQRIRTVVDARQQAGTHAIVWDGRDANGVDAPAGVYFVRLVTPDEQATRKLTLIR